jgi:hypothetical protein
MVPFNSDIPIDSLIIVRKTEDDLAEKYIGEVLRVLSDDGEIQPLTGDILERAVLAFWSDTKVTVYGKFGDETIYEDRNGTRVRVGDILDPPVGGLFVFPAIVLDNTSFFHLKRNCLGGRSEFVMNGNRIMSRQVREPAKPGPQITFDPIKSELGRNGTFVYVDPVKDVWQVSGGGTMWDEKDIYNSEKERKERKEESMTLYWVAVVQNPTPKDIENGKAAELVIQPTAVFANSKDSAIASITLPEKCNKNMIQVLIREF